MSRRTVLLGCLFAATSLTSTGCHCCWRPFLWRWNCGGCCPPCYTPASPAPVVSGPVVAAPAMAGPAECACFSPPSGPIAVSAPPAPGPVINGGMPTYTVPPTYIGPTTPLPGPQVMPEKPATPPTTGGMK